MAYQFSPQVGATTAQKGRAGWSQSLAVQAGIGSGLEAARIKEQRSQAERTLAQNQQQFDTRLGWEQQKFNQEQSMAKRQQKYTEKQNEKAERIGQFGMSLQSFELGMNLLNEYDINPLENMGLKGGGSTPKTATVKTGEAPTPAAGGEASLAQQWGGLAAKGFGGAALGGLTGSQFAQAVGGQGKTQSTAGGAIGGGLGAWSATGNPYIGLGGMFAGGLLGYLLG